MQSKASTVAEYLAELPEDRRAAVEKLRAVFKKSLDKKIVEHMNYGMIGYSVPHSVYPPGYHCDPSLPLPFAAIASQKNNLAVYSCALYADADENARFVKAWRATGRKLDMGKSCIRFKKIEDVPLDVLGDTLRRMTVKRFVGIYEASRQAQLGAKAARKKTAKK